MIALKFKIKNWLFIGGILALGIWMVIHPSSNRIKHLVNKVVEHIEVSSSNRAFAMEELSAKSAVVMDQDTGEVLFYKNDQERKAPASTTKMMTALLALEMADMNTVVTVGKEVLWTEPGESVAGLSFGQRLTWKQLVEAMMLPSGNDAARTIAVQLGRQSRQDASLSEEEAMTAFVDLMNKRAEELGLRNTHFANPHGLHNANHYSSAYDLAVIAKEAMKNELFRSIVGQVAAEVKLVSSAPSAVMKTLTNRNRLLQQDSGYYYEGATGIKTGFTDEAGYCLVSSAEREGHRIIAVVLHSNADSVWSDSQELLDYGFERFKA
ncbi:D-alanyl-D-alanine carboxypeptidase [Paenibacillus profundus]|uniref:D-alanyl-D-alanine carboxypeptidase n=1 Tax=Paenibacillus profundus TaxID=1173085 RepID=A0ABS8YAM8_9BACL|nr:D-alanyl-D-alanine carboxypeptidase family protein [Paenibacillus profundus]MCE5168437.1 D-alanyl-D-alanine carboxypeptidase [Paenibacillus profundus]